MEVIRTRIVVVAASASVLASGFGLTLFASPDRASRAGSR
jgi:hypothetical protein